MTNTSTPSTRPSAGRLAVLAVVTVLVLTVWVWVTVEERRELQAARAEADQLREQVTDAVRGQASIVRLNVADRKVTVRSGRREHRDESRQAAGRRTCWKVALALEEHDLPRWRINVYAGNSTARRDLVGVGSTGSCPGPRPQ